jgi:hypothetical protein
MRVFTQSETSTAILPQEQIASTSLPSEEYRTPLLRYGGALAALLVAVGQPSTLAAAMQLRPSLPDMATYIYVQRRRRISRRDLLARAEAILLNAEAYRSALKDAEARLSVDADDILG